MGGETDTSIVANPERNSVDVVGGNMFERSFSIETVLSVSGGRDNVKIEKKKNEFNYITRIFRNNFNIV